jgi:hypothetical protein
LDNFRKTDFSTRFADLDKRVAWLAQTAAALAGKA